MFKPADSADCNRKGCRCVQSLLAPWQFLDMHCCQTEMMRFTFDRSHSYYFFWVNFAMFLRRAFQITNYKERKESDTFQINMALSVFRTKIIHRFYDLSRCLYFQSHTCAFLKCK